MTRRSEPFFASFALTLLLALVLFYGCRAFDPEPVIVNRPPETYIIGAPAETTGTRYLRHMYWYGTDHDGEVVRFIFAITDSTIQDHEFPNVDEESANFDPADDITTLEPFDWRTIGYTALTDSVFLFDINRGSTPSKDITFHLVAVDDRGAIDPTPARLHFFNNSLGNPVLKFHLFTFEDLGGGNMDWVHRWTGTPDGPSIGESPELSNIPTTGYSRRFRLDWEASSPNGGIVGYRYKADQRNVPFTPPLNEDGEKQWDATLVSFEYANDVPPEDLPDCRTTCDLNPDAERPCRLLETSDCPPDQVRWPSANYVLRVEALDLALVETEGPSGELKFRVNYEPETRLIDDATWPLYRIADGLGGVIELPIAPPDTVPMGAYVIFNATGWDKTDSLTAPDSYGNLCCDTIVRTSRVSFQAEYEATIDKGRFSTQFSTQASVAYRANAGIPGDVDTIGFNVGPFQYNVYITARDEHSRVDESPELYQFTGGLQPRLLSTIPANGDSAVFSNPLLLPWPGSVPYVATGVNRYWTGNDWVADPNICIPEPCTAVTPGTLYQFLAEFDGSGHSSEPSTTIRAWQFRYFTDHDPFNLISDGRESKDFSQWIDKPAPGNQWHWDTVENEAIEIFVPNFFWAFQGIFEPNSNDALFAAQGKWMARRLGMATMTLRGRTTAGGDTWPIYNRVRPTPGEAINFGIEEGGRRTEFLDLRWSLWLGIDTDGDSIPDRFWPDFPYEDYN